ncbi:hypothetical protein N7488_011207 [Penicillium malachiteum]|nr:hypothetical protein N7488_011207 [Penicillium malachiteum]
MLFCQSLLYIVTFQAAMAIALPQGELGIEGNFNSKSTLSPTLNMKRLTFSDKCKHAMDIAKAADPSILE